MKKWTIAHLFLVFALFCPTLEAKPCVFCRAEMPEAAIACLSCGRYQSQAPQKKAVVDPKAAVLRLFSPVDTFAATLQNGVYSEIVGGYPEFRSIVTTRIGQFNNAQARLPEEIQILGRWYQEKIRAIDTMVGTMKSLRVDPSHRDAILLFSSHVLTLYDKGIQRIRASGPFTPKDVQQLKVLARNLVDRLQHYEVRAKFLKVGKTSVPEGSPFAVLDVRKGKAHVLILCPTGADAPVQGWISLGSLRQRTTWSANSETFFQGALSD
jgi:hypothetical protein